MADQQAATAAVAKTSVTLPGEIGEPAQPAQPAQGKEKTIKVDFSKPMAKSPKREDGSPFVKAKEQEKRVKVFCYGDTGTLKTRLALQFPHPVVIDMERGTTPYTNEFNFHVLHTTSAEEVMQSVDWLLTNDHQFRTLVIDPITIYWEGLQKKWSDIFLRRNKGGKGYKFDYYDFQMRDWGVMKGEIRELIRKLLALDMNVVVTAHQKKEYGDGEMKVIGETFDGEKKLPYYFDVVLHHYKDGKGRVLAKVDKDRFGKLPQEPFEPSFAVFETTFNGSSLKRKAKPVSYATAEQQKTIKAACGRLGISEEAMERRLATYGAETLTDLSSENADIIIGKLEQAIAAAASSETK